MSNCKPSCNPKLCIIGHARHGKDTVAEILRDHFGMTFCSSSFKACELFIFDVLKEEYGYKTPQECFDDRDSHREEWASLIREYNFNNKTRLAEQIMSDSDIYVGMRDNGEIQESLRKKIFDAVIWVDASERKPPEDSSSFDIDISYADFIVDNNGQECDLFSRVATLYRLLTTGECSSGLYVSRYRYRSHPRGIEYLEHPWNI